MRVIAQIGWTPRPSCVIRLIGAGWYYNRRPRNYGQRRWT